MMTERAPIPPKLIINNQGLNELTQSLSAEPSFAIDTESNSLYVYRERLCLIQFSIPGRDFILDPFCFADLSLLAPLFANPKQQKIFHAAEYDLLCLKRDYGFQFAGIFDTMLAARTLGWQRTGLDAILDERFSVKINKKHQRANWGIRPLPQNLLNYAQLDTHFLLPLRDLQWNELLRCGRAEEALEEFERLGLARPEMPVVEIEQFWRIKGSYSLEPRQTAILRELHEYREKQAEKMDLPRFKIMNDSILMEIATGQPKNFYELARVAGMTSGQLKRYGHGLLKAVRRGLTAPQPIRPRHKRLPSEVRERFERLQQWRKEKGKDRGVEPGAILSREALWTLAHRPPRTPDDLNLLNDIGARRRELYGSELIKLLHPKKDAE